MLYQGVTLGVLHFIKEDGILKKGYKRHPAIGNNVVIGANTWIQEDVPDGTAVFIAEHPKLQSKEKKQ